MNEAMLSYHDARKYSSTPFPFPYTAAIELVLMVTRRLLLGYQLARACLLHFLLGIPHVVAPLGAENPFEVNAKSPLHRNVEGDDERDSVGRHLGAHGLLPAHEAEHFLFSRVGVEFRRFSTPDSCSGSLF